jgi:hypothetical protein
MFTLYARHFAGLSCYETNKHAGDPLPHMLQIRKRYMYISKIKTVKNSKWLSKTQNGSDKERLRCFAFPMKNQAE